MLATIVVIIITEFELYHYKILELEETLQGHTVPQQYNQPDPFLFYRNFLILQNFLNLISRKNTL